MGNLVEMVDGPTAHGIPLGDWLCERRAVVFDLDGTLVDSMPDLAGAMDDVLADFGLEPVPVGVVAHAIDLGLDAIAAEVLRTVGAPPALRARIVEAYAARYAQRRGRLTRAYPGVHAVLQRLRTAGVALAVCTNKPTADARSVLGHAGLDGLVNVVVGADAIARRKPDPEPLLHAVALCSATAAGAVLVGDSLVDARCAAAAAVPFVHFTGGYGGPAATTIPARGRFAAFDLELLPRTGDAHGHHDVGARRETFARRGPSPRAGEAG